MIKNSVEKKPRKRSKNNGGVRRGSGRPKGALNKATLEFRDYVREHTDRAVDLHVEVMDNTKLPYALRMEAARWLVERGYGKAPIQISGPNEGPVQVEYQSFEEVRAVLLTQGIDYDRLPLPRMLEHRETISDSNGSS